MPYTVNLNKASRGFLDKIEQGKYSKLLGKLLDLEIEPRPPGCRKLNVIDGYRIRYGNYRVLYTIDDNSKQVFIYKIDHRKAVYRKK